MKTIWLGLSLVLCSLRLAADDRLLAAPPNRPENADKPYVLLVGLDGFRWDYAEKFGAKNILAFRNRGSSAARLAPSFPSTTFPNLYSLVTGLRPEKHGLVAMSFFDPEWGKQFSYLQNAPEGKWYEQGTPLWNLAEQAGMRTACHFWPGSEAEIRGGRPTVWFTYNALVPNSARVGKVLDWLRLPVAHRPHLITLYFADIDTAGHNYGPNSPQVRDAVLSIDRTLGVLFRELETIKPQVNVFLVSDHGMVEANKTIDLTQRADFSGTTIINGLTMIHIYSKDKTRLHQIEKSLSGHRDEYFVYRREKMPKHLHYRSNPRAGDLIVLSAGTHFIAIRNSARMDRHFATRRYPAGSHGNDPLRFPDLDGIFYAAGPDINSGVRLGRLENTAIFGLVANLLGLSIPPGADSGKELTHRLRGR